MAISWKPTHPGNWLFHCHLLQHFEPKLSHEVADVTKADTAAESGHDATGMAGLVAGIQIKSAENSVVPIAPASPTRKLTLTISRTAQLLAARHPIQLEIRYGETVTRTPGGSKLGPTLVLHRGEDTEITVVNRLTSPNGNSLARN